MGTEKGMVEFNGKRLIEYAIDTLKDLCSEILISSNASCYDYLGYNVVPDIIPNIGPMGGIYSCLLRSSGQCNMVLSCDMPFTDSRIFTELYKFKNDSLICIPAHNDQFYEPLCGIYMKDVVPEMEEFILMNNFKLPDLFKKTKFRPFLYREHMPGIDESYFMSINSPGDLKKACELIKGR